MKDIIRLVLLLVCMWLSCSGLALAIKSNTSYMIVYLGPVVIVLLVLMAVMERITKR